jgi:uncharacterized protein (UPF0210 family)
VRNHDAATASKRQQKQQQQQKKQRQLLQTNNTWSDCISFRIRRATLTPIAILTASHQQQPHGTT